MDQLLCPTCFKVWSVQVASQNSRCPNCKSLLKAVKGAAGNAVGVGAAAGGVATVKAVGVVAPVVAPVAAPVVVPAAVGGAGRVLAGSTVVKPAAVRGGKMKRVHKMILAGAVVVAAGVGITFGIMGIHGSAAKGSGVGSGQVMTAQGVFDAMSPAIVTIEIFDGLNTPLALGSGVILTADGWIVTNYHVIADAKRVLVHLPNGSVYEATGIGADSKEDDVAMIKVNGSGLPVAELETKEVVVGQKVFAIGSPEGLRNTLSEGLVSAIRESGSKSRIQTSAAFTHGSSGGALLDETGKVVGLTSSGYEGGGDLNFAIPAKVVSMYFERSKNLAASKVVGLDAMFEHLKFTEDMVGQGEDWELRNVKTVQVVVKMNDQAAALGLNAGRMEAEVSAKLKQSGIETTDEPRDADGELEILVVTNKGSTDGAGVVGYSISESFSRVALLIGSPRKLGMMRVWSDDGEMGTVRADNVVKLQEGESEIVDKFLEAWKVGNQ